jgi:hypothetical protein
MTRYFPLAVPALLLALAARADVSVPTTRPAPSEEIEKLHQQLAQSNARISALEKQLADLQQRLQLSQNLPPEFRSFPNSGLPTQPPQQTPRPFNNSFYYVLPLNNH